jgi:hypothetical protein
MPYREIITVCSKNHAKHKNAPYGPNVDFLNVKPRGMITRYIYAHSLGPGKFKFIGVFA